MRELFFYTLAGCLVVAAATWALYLVGQAFMQLFSDWRLSRELDQLESQGAARRQQKLAAQQKRLDTGCEHDFRTDAVGLPPHVCVKCGIERDRPVGMCDHKWQVKVGPVPFSECAHCGKTYHPLQAGSDPTKR